MPEDKLIDVFSTVLNVPAEELNEDTSPDNTENWDSLAAMQLVAEIEETFSVRLSTRDIMTMDSIGRARDVLREKNADGI